METKVFIDVRMDKKIEIHRQAHRHTYIHTVEYYSVIKNSKILAIHSNMDET